MRFFPLSMTMSLWFDLRNFAKKGLVLHLETTLATRTKIAFQLKDSILKFPFRLRNFYPTFRANSQWSTPTVPKSTELDI